MDVHIYLYKNVYVIYRYIYIYDGFSKVLFPISAKNRIPCVTPLVLLVKKVILKIQVKCSKSTSLEKKWFVSCKKS